VGVALTHAGEPGVRLKACRAPLPRSCRSTRAASRPGRRLSLRPARRRGRAPGRRGLAGRMWTLRHR